MPDNKDAAVQEAMLDAYLDDLKSNASKGAAVVAVAQHEEADLETFVTDKANADTVVVYNQHDGKASKVLMSMLSKQLRKRFPRVTDIPKNLWGKRAFGMAPPPGLAEVPHLTCWFHPDNPKRALINELGLNSAVCNKANIPTAMDVELHVKFKHPQRYRVIQEHERRQREDEDRSLMREQLSAMRELAASAAKPAEKAKA